LALGEDNKGQVYIKGKRSFVVNLWGICSALIVQNRRNLYFFPCVCTCRNFCAKSSNSPNSIVHMGLSFPEVLISFSHNLCFSIHWQLILVFTLFIHVSLTKSWVMFTIQALNTRIMYLSFKVKGSSKISNLAWTINEHWTRGSSEWWILNYDSFSSGYWPPL
jgi:hypothetical protein